MQSLRLPVLYVLLFATAACRAGGHAVELSLPHLSPALAAGGEPSALHAQDAQDLANTSPSAIAKGLAVPNNVAPSLPRPLPTTISLVPSGDDTLDALLAQGDKAFEDGDLTKADAIYTQALRLAPRRAAPMVGVARVRAAKASPSLAFAAAEKNGEVLSAAKDLKRAVALEPACGPAQAELGRAFLLLGDGPNAEAALRKGAQLLPDDAEAHSAFGIALLALGKTDEALVELTRARTIDPGSAARRGNLGTVLFMRGRVAEAVKEYELQAQLLPLDARAHSDLGTAWLAEGDFSRSEPELRRAIELDATRATFHSNLGYALQLSGKVAAAIAEYRQALKLDSKLSSAWINLATALSRDPKTHSEAREALTTAGRLDPTDPRVKANLEELDALEKAQPKKR